MSDILDSIDLPDAPELPEGEELLAERLTPEQVRSQLTGLLINLADALADDVLFFARRHLVDGELAAAAQAIIFAALRMRIQLSDVEYAVLAECLVGLDESTANLDYLHVGQNARPLYFEFAAGPAARAQGLEVGDDALAPESRIPDPQAEEIDAQFLNTIAEISGIVGVWRAWRYPATETTFPSPRPCYLVEAADAAVATQVLNAVYGPGGSADGPLCEVYAQGSELPQLQRALQFRGILVHSGQEEPVFKFADVFSGEPGPDGLPQEYEKIDDDELIASMADYLANGRPLMLADSEGEDLFDPARGPVVPLHLRTDGEWIWSEASVYYLTQHRIAPPADFRAVLEGLRELPTLISDTTLHQAASWLQAE